MWRMIPLLKMTLRMFFFSAAIFTVLHGLINFLLLSGGEYLYLLPSQIFGKAEWAVKPAFLLTLPLPLVTILFFREIRRPATYRFTMLTVTLIVIIAIFGNHFAALARSYKFSSGDYYAVRLAVNLVGNSLPVLMSAIVADKYVRETSERKRQPSKRD